jgi:TetR/AcrR family transcriptional regulator
MTEPRQGRRTRDPERSRRAILDAARDEFVAHGFTGGRTGRIAEAAGVPQGLLYHYFDNKEGLFDAVMEDTLAPYFNGMLDMLQSAEAPDLALLENSVRRYFQFLHENPHVARLLAWWFADQAWEGKPLTRKQGVAEAVELLGAARIREGQEAGFIREDLDPALVIKTFIDMCVMWHMSKGRHMLHTAPGEEQADLDARYLDHMVEVFLNGVVAPAHRPD